jgi:hypothetical protein
MIMLECSFSALVDLVQEVGEDSVRHILDVGQETLNLRIGLLLVRLEVCLNTHLDDNYGCTFTLSCGARFHCSNKRH